MRTGRTPAIGLLAVLAIASAGCATAQRPKPQDVAFVRGCWVEKAGRDRSAVAFLRLLTYGETYAGPLTRMKDGQMGLAATFVFARDGSQLAITAAGETRVFTASGAPDHEPEAGVAWFEQKTPGGLALVHVMSAADELSIAMPGGKSSVMILERDGCD